MERVKCPGCEWVNAPGRSTCVRCGTPIPVVNVEVRSQAPPGEQATRSADAIEFQQGQLVANRYTVQGMIGRGGMGCIYRVHDNTLKEVVALKTLLPEFVREKLVVERFFNEARIARALSHPNIIRVHDIGATGKTVYISMEYLAGKSLRTIEEELPPGQRLPLATILKILDELCAALEYAHQFTVHRDIKPENVMITKEGKVKLMDFGISKLMVDSNLTATSIVMGTPHYMSPEQLRNSAKVDRRSDVYSIGVMLYEMLTGDTPDAAESPARPKDVPPALDPIVRKCLQHNPADRYQSATELREALREIPENLATMQRPSGVRGRFVPGDVLPRAVGVVLCVVVLASAGAGLWKVDANRRELVKSLAATRAGAPTGVAETTQANQFEVLSTLTMQLETQASNSQTWTIAARERQTRVEEILGVAREKWELAQTYASAGKLSDALEEGLRAFQCYLAPRVWPEGMIFVTAPTGSTEDWPWGFFISKNPVTDEEFAEFVRQNEWDWPAEVYRQGAPMTWASFYDALGFAASRKQGPEGMSIPSYGQWRRAVEHARSRGTLTEWTARRTGGGAEDADAEEAPAPVEFVVVSGSWEWTRTPWSERQSAESPADLGEVQTGPWFGTEYVLAGGEMDASGAFRVSEERSAGTFEQRYRNVVFRCVVNLPSTVEDAAQFWRERRE